MIKDRKLINRLNYISPKNEPNIYYKKEAERNYINKLMNYSDF